MDCVIDGITCIQQRNDPVYGAQDLQTWAWSVQSIACIFVSIVGGYIVQYTKARYSFLLYALVAFSGLVSASMMNKTLEDSDY